MKRFKAAPLTIMLMAGALSLFVPPALAQTVTNIYNGTNFLWYTTTNIWSTNLNRVNISNLFVYMDQEFARMKADWGVTTPRSQYYLWVDPNTGGGFAAGDISQIHNAIGSTAPGIGVAYDAYNNTAYGIFGFWAYALGTHETANLLTGQALSAGWPRDWWADDKSPFPGMSAVRVEAELGQNAVSSAHDSSFGSDPLYKMMKDIQTTNGWAIFSNMFANVKADGIQWTSIDRGWNPSAILTAYVTAYMVMGSTNTLSYMHTRFFNNVLPGYSSNTTWQVMNAWTNWHNNGGSSNAFLNGNYLSVGGFPDFNLSMPTPNTLTLTPGGSASAFFQITNTLGFTGSVSLSATGLPSGLTATFSQLLSNNYRITLAASAGAPEGAATATIVGTSPGVQPSIWHWLRLPVTVSTNAQTAVNLNLVANRYGIGNDHVVTGDNGGIDGAGFEYSGVLLGNSRTYSNTLFAIPGATDGQQGTLNAVTGVNIPLPAGNFSAIKMLGSANGGNKLSQSFTINYTDGTSAAFSQSLSDWTAPQGYAGETTVLTMPYSDINLGTFTANRYLYGYTFPLDTNKIVKSFIIPGNGVVAIAFTLNGNAILPQPLTAAISATPTNGAAPLMVQFNGVAGGGYMPPPFDTTDDQLGTITARGDNPPNETKAKAFDNSSSTKWLDFSSGTSRSSWIQYQYPGGQKHVVTQYTITSANDAPERDPRDWKLLGSTNNGASFVTLDVQTNQAFPARFFTKFYLFTNATACNIYRFTNDTVLNVPTLANSVQLAELEFLEVPPPAYTWSWNFADGGTAATNAPQHTFTTNGTYTVALVVSDGISLATNTMAINVFPPVLSAIFIPGGGGASSLQLSWPTWAASYHLYTATNLAPPAVWSLVTNSVATNLDTLILTVSATAENRFFQLKNP